MICENPKLRLRDKNGKLVTLTDLEAFQYKAYVTKLADNPNSKPQRLDFFDDVVTLPCGHCLLCRAALQEEWATRCWLESQQYDNNMFVTLTYNPQSTPKEGVNKEDLSRFLHTLREYFRRNYNHSGIRYYACGEYGGKTARPHYHLILFNCPHFADEKFYKKNEYNHKMYRSEILNKLWHKGNCVIGSATRHSIDYVTSFMLKANGKIPEEANREFQCMSNRKGLGYDYLIKNIDSIIADDKIRITGNKTVAVPKYFDKKICEIIGVERFKNEVLEPRKRRWQETLQHKMAETGLSEYDLRNSEIKRRKQQILLRSRDLNE